MARTRGLHHRPLDANPGRAGRAATHVRHRHPRRRPHHPALAPQSPVQHRPAFAGSRQQGRPLRSPGSLGGLRRRRKDSPNTAWRNASFQGFADYMLTEDFAAGLEELRKLAAQGRVALMCAEAVPWRCHRSLIADALTARGAKVEHITGKSHTNPHRMTPFARIEGTSVTYPGDSDVPPPPPKHG